MSQKKSFFYEIPIFYLVLYGINWIFLPESPGFVDIDPHPYWLGILLFGIRYGLTAGVIAGVVAGFEYLYSAWFYLDRYVFEDLSFYTLPFSFVVFSFLVGYGAKYYQRQINWMKNEIEDAEHGTELLKEDIRVLEDVNRGLEKRVVTRMKTLVILYEGARRLEAVKLGELYVSIIGFIAKTLEADEAALYLKEKNDWVLKENYGWKDIRHLL